MQRILITGGSGLIGLPLISALHKRGFKVDAVDNDWRVEKPFVAECIDGDLRDAETCKMLVERNYDLIVNLAAMARVIDCEKQPAEAMSTNVRGVANLFGAIEARGRFGYVDGIKTPALLHASSRVVYGQPESLPVSEDAPLLTGKSVYGQTKMFGEESVARLIDNEVDAYIVRYSNVYGGLNDHEGRVIPNFVARALQHYDLHVEGPGKVFDFVHVSDAVEATARMCECILMGSYGCWAPADGALHVVTGDGTGLHDLAAMVIAECQLQGRPSSSLISTVPPRTYGTKGFVGDPAKAQRILDWRSKTYIRNGLRQYVRALIDAELPGKPLTEVLA